MQDVIGISFQSGGKNIRVLCELLECTRGIQHVRATPSVDLRALDMPVLAYGGFVKTSSMALPKLTSYACILGIFTRFAVGLSR